MWKSRYKTERVVPVFVLGAPPETRDYWSEFRNLHLDSFEGFPQSVLDHLPSKRLNSLTCTDSLADLFKKKGGLFCSFPPLVGPSRPDKRRRRAPEYCMCDVPQVFCLQHRLVPTLVGAEEIFGGSKVRTVACGNVHTLAVTEAGELWAWGLGAYGRLGHNDEQDTKEFMNSSYPPKGARALGGLSDVSD